MPGTVAQVLLAANVWRPYVMRPLREQDFWYRIEFEGNGPETLRFEGLATIAEVWLNGRCILKSDSMYIAHDVDVELTRTNVIHICFRALGPRLAVREPKPRARWRTNLVAHASLRQYRSTLFGHMTGWCPEIDVIGPWRAVWRIRREYANWSWNVTSRVENTTGIVAVRLTMPVTMRRDFPAEIEVGGRRARLERVSEQACHGQVSLPDVDLWWPHTHGPSPLYAVAARIGSDRINLGKTGFRTIAADSGADGEGFALRINGETVFCRGAVWTTADPLALHSAPDAYRRWLTSVRDANLNMVRVSGTMFYESPQFHAMCDELGLLVWQDFMLANFDYPTTQDFQDLVAQEATQQLRRLQLSPSLAVLCGGSEIYQQAAMMGAELGSWKNPIFEDCLPAICAQLKPDVPYIANTPLGGDVPFTVSSGVSHYFGVGAYQRPLKDAREAKIRFASECLAFANVPQESTASEHLHAQIQQAGWKAHAPRDRSVTWNFEDVRDAYLERLYALDARDLKRADPERYLYASRAVVAEIFERVFAEWRRCGSTTAGALVWQLQDITPGAGWGIIDSLGEPKSVWYALKRANRSINVSLTDEGLDGLVIHVRNETTRSRSLRATLMCLRDGAVPVVNASALIDVSARSTREISSTEIIGNFFDSTYAYRFGPPAHDITFVSLHDAETGQLLAEAWHSPNGRHPIMRELKLHAIPRRTPEGTWHLDITAQRHAQSVHILDRHYRPDDDFFELNPLQPKTITLSPRAGDCGLPEPEGVVMALNGQESASYGRLA